MAEIIRLDKFLVEMGEGSRSQIKEMAKKGRVHVNGQPEKKTDRKIEIGKDEVTVDGRSIAYASYEYFMLNKPAGVVSATEDNLHKTVIQLIETAKRSDLFPVGRLDIDTEGLLLITNDGDLAHQLLSPKKHVDKVYLAHVRGQMPSDAAAQFEDGIVLSDGVKTLPAVLKINGKTESGEETIISLTIREGKFHQVKRMFEAIGCQVVYLKRLSMGSLKLDESLQPGQYRSLTSEELKQLKAGES